MKTINQRIFAGFFLATLILLLMAAFIHHNFDRYKNTNDWVSHTYIVISELDGVLSSTLDVQSAERGFVITGEPLYLGPADLAVPKIATHFTALAQLTSDNPTQKNNLTVLKTLVDQRVDFANAIIEAYRKQSPQAAQAMVRSGTGKLEMDRVRDRVRTMKEEEFRLLQIRQAAVAEAGRSTLTVSAIGLLACIAILSLMFGLTLRESRRRAETEAMLNNSVAETGRRMTQTQAISRMGDYLQSCGELNEAYSVIATNMPFLLPGTRGTIATYNNSRNSIVVAGSWGETHATNTEFTPEECWALRRGNVHYNSTNSHEPKCQHIHDLPAGGMLCLPMQAHGEVHGLLCIEADDAELLTNKNADVIRAISEQTSLALANLRLQAKLRVQSLSDPLTSLFNRRYMETTLEREISRAYRYKQPLSVLIMDVDHFKMFNDTWGHEAGDAVLIAFGKLLKQTIRSEDVACRFGGEEFIVILPGAAPEIALQRAQKIADATRRLQVSYKNQLLGAVTISIGIANFPAQGNSADELVANADSALYRAKKAGRDRIVVTEPQIEA